MVGERKRIDLMSDTLLTPTQAKVWELHLAGVRDWDIANSLNLSYGTISVYKCIIRRRLGISYVKPTPTLNYIAKAIRAGLTRPEIAERLGILPTSVSCAKWRAKQKKETV